MNTHFKKLLPLLGVVLTALLLTYCKETSTGSSNDSQVRQMRVTLSVGSENSFTVDKTIQGGWHDTNKVELKQVKFLIHHLELGTVSLDSLDFEVDNVIVDLPLNGDTLVISTEQIPVGSYNRLNVEIDKDAIEDSLLNDSTGYYSLAVLGTYNGEDFLFRSKREFRHEFKFDPPIEVTDSTTSLNLNLSINVDRWFKYADPTNPDDQTKIERNILKSFYADCRYDYDHDWRWHGDYDDHD